MSREHLFVARTMEVMSVEDICLLIEASDKNSDVPVMERLVIGAMAAPRLVAYAREVMSIAEAYGARAKAAGAHEAEAAASGIAGELRQALLSKAGGE